MCAVLATLVAHVALAMLVVLVRFVVLLVLVVLVMLSVFTALVVLQARVASQCAATKFMSPAHGPRLLVRINVARVLGSLGARCEVACYARPGGYD